MHKHKKSSTLLTISRNTPDTASLRLENQYIVRHIRSLTENTFVLRFDRNEMNFQAGQHLTLGLPGDTQTREYSIYSSTDQPFLEVLVREVNDGLVSKKLHRVNVGDLLQVEGPFGFFTLYDKLPDNKKYLFIATGTGIAPFHSIIGSNPKLNYKILHGVRYRNEAYEKDFYSPEKYTSCTSRDQQGEFFGRVTDYLNTYYEADSDTLVYLCGNYEMIYQVYNILTSKGLNPDQIKTEVYF
jgi:ferredoxin/flavodoxin---NADP+ reductase